MSDQNLKHRGASSGYTPAPVNKTRSVTGNHAKVSGAAPKVEPNQNDSALHQPQQDQSRPSIQLNLNTINQATQSVVERETEEQAKLAEFSPLSSAPAPSYDSFNQHQGQPFNTEGSDWAAAAIPDSLTPPPHGALEQHASSPDLYKSRRRSLWILTIISVATSWFIAMAIQVGIPRLIEDPYGETMSLILGAELDEEALDQLRTPGAQTLVNINEGRAVANLLSVERLDRDFIAIQGAVLNESTQPLSMVLLKVTLRSPEDAKTAWAKRFEITCCDEAQLDGLSKEQLKQLAQRYQDGSAQEQELSLGEGQSARFTFVTKLDRRRQKLKRNEAPVVEVEVTFFE